ncbi:MAG: hypothetical protein PUC27_02620 [Clostridium sp.]|nr:hypothetical protein [Clostridium sp.]
MLVLALLCAGIAVFADGQASKIPDAGQAADSTAKETPPAETELINDAKKTPAPEEEKPAAETETATKWRLQLEDEVAYVGFFYGRVGGPYCTEFYPGIDDEQLIAEFVEMLNNIRMVEISREAYIEQYKEDIIENYTGAEMFLFYGEDGCPLGTISFSRAVSESSYYPEENLGWSRIISVYVPNENGVVLKDSSCRKRFLIDEDTFDEELIERVWRECLGGRNPDQFYMDYLAYMDNGEELDLLNIKTVDIIAQGEDNYSENHSDIIVVPVE